VKQARLNHLDTDATISEKARQQADLHQQDWQAKLTQAHHKTQGLIAQARAQATSQSQTRIDSARQQAQRTVDSSLTTLATWRVDTLETLASDRQALRDQLLDKLAQPSQKPILTSSAR
jgi:F0F1-type ATP synthase membrane subunit b/b'